MQKAVLEEARNLGRRGWPHADLQDLLVRPGKSMEKQAPERTRTTWRDRWRWTSCNRCDLTW
jgi:hypothetical protein